LLPALASILKIRKRKLAQSNTNSNSLTSTNVNYDSTDSVINSLSVKISSFENSTTQNGKFVNALNSISLQTEISNNLNLSFLSRAQITTLFYR